MALPQPVEVTQSYFGGMYEVTNGAVRKYYSFGGSTVALRDQDGLKYILTDHLGSVVAVTDDAGTLLSQQRYLPFGEVRQDVGAITQTDFGYTSQRALPEMGLMDYRARMYSGRLGRFTQPDNLMQDPSYPQTLNRYGYVQNRPISLTDPTGHKCVGEPEECLDEDGHPLNGVNKRKSSRDENNSDIDIDALVRLCFSNPNAEECLELQQPCSEGETVCLSDGTGYHFDHYETWINPSKVDWWNIAVNGLGILGNIVFFVGVFEVVPAFPAAVFLEFTEIAAIAYDASQTSIATGEGVGALTWDAFAKVADIENFLPGLSGVINLANIQAEIQDAKEQVPVYVPDVPYIPRPPNMGLPPFMFPKLQP